MSAFNRRYEPRTLFGLPAPTAVAAVAILPLLLFTLLLPAAFKPVTALAMVAALAVAAAGLWLGDDRPFLRVMLAAARERDRVTSETRTDA
ncbi:MAG: hypothetical protein M0Z84_13955 [Gammaproteobacteria bacterium]|nr:hypothetical protein [Gammaproteobacteria bacterium]